MTRPWGSCGTLRAVAACAPPLLCAGQQPKGGSGVGGRSFPLRCSRPRMAGSTSGPRPARAAAGARAPACRGCGREPPALARLSCLPRTRRGCWSVPAGVSLAMVFHRLSRRKKVREKKKHETREAANHVANHQGRCRGKQAAQHAPTQHAKTGMRPSRGGAASRRTRLPRGGKVRPPHPPPSARARSAQQPRAGVVP